MSSDQVRIPDSVINLPAPDFSMMPVETLRERMEQAYCRTDLARQTDWAMPEVVEHYAKQARALKAELIVRLHPELEQTSWPGLSGSMDAWICHRCGRVSINSDMDWFLGECRDPS